MNFVFIMNPFGENFFEKDTSFAFMLGAARKNHNIFYVPNNGVSSDRNNIVFHACRWVVQNDATKPIETHETILLKSQDVDAVFIRTDPPFDANYLNNTWLLDRLPSKVFVMNSPSGIRTVNEKIWVTQFTDFIPKTIVSSDKNLLLSFLKDVGQAVTKPTDGFGGQSVFKINYADSNAIVAMETLTEQWRKKIIVQEYMSAAEQGDKRVLLLDGQPLGAVLRVHNKIDHRNNFFAGGDAQPAIITENERHIIKHLHPYLQQLGLHFVGLDFMGERLIEVNVTSPTCLQEMNRLYKKTLEDNVIAFIEKQITTRA